LIIATIEPPKGINIIGVPKFMEERICFSKKDLKGEKLAHDVSESIFFVEYHLHS